MAFEIRGPDAARLALRGAMGRLWSGPALPRQPAWDIAAGVLPSDLPVVAPATLARDDRLAVLVNRPAGLADAVSVVGWVAEHAAELDTDPARLLVGGERAGDAVAATLAGHSRNQGWPSLLGPLLVAPAADVHPGPARQPEPSSSPVAPISSPGSAYF